MFSTRISALVAYLFVAAAAFPQTAQEIVLDLALQAPGTHTETIDANERFFIVVKNHTNAEYDIKVDRELPDLDPLPLLAAGDPQATDCELLVETFDAARRASASEAQVALEAAKARASATACSAIERDALEKFIVEVTTANFGPYGLASGEKLKFAISRGSGDAQKTWILEVSTPRPGRWRMLYGFNFVPNEDEHYFLRARDDGKFDIVKEREDNDLAFVPTIFASWLSRTQQIRGWGWGLSAGLGFETDQPVVFAGPTFTYRENVSINLGLVMQQPQRLNPRVDLAQPVDGTTTEDQLHRRDGYRPNWFIGIGFRFNDNPFKAQAPEEEDEPDE